MAHRFLVLHDYHTEGWSIQADVPTIWEAVDAREADLANGGGTSIIVEVIPTVEAYRRAAYYYYKDEQEAAQQRKG